MQEQDRGYNCITFLRNWVVKRQHDIVSLGEEKRLLYDRERQINWVGEFNCVFIVL